MRCRPHPQQRPRLMSGTKIALLLSFLMVLCGFIYIFYFFSVKLHPLPSPYPLTLCAQRTTNSAKRNRWRLLNYIERQQEVAIEEEESNDSNRYQDIKQLYVYAGASVEGEGCLWMVSGIVPLFLSSFFFLSLCFLCNIWTLNVTATPHKELEVICTFYNRLETFSAPMKLSYV